jgi:hypothetical protein
VLAAYVTARGLYRRIRGNRERELIDLVDQLASQITSGV